MHAARRLTDPPNVGYRMGGAERGSHCRRPQRYVLGTIEHAIPPAIQLFMAKRMHAHITRVHAGHLSMIAGPGAMAQVIAEAARARG